MGGMKHLLYLYGPNGVGKTRLLQMMEVTLAEYCESEGVIRTGAENLLEEMLSELPLCGIDQFCAKYSEIENLMVDNCWVLSRRPHAARMLTQIFRNRLNRGMLTIVASDLPLIKSDNTNGEIADLFDDAVFINLGRGNDRRKHQGVHFTEN